MLAQVEGARPYGLDTSIYKERNPHGIQVVVTGAGWVFPLGNTLEEGWINMQNAVNGIEPINFPGYPQINAKVAGTVKVFDPVERLRGVVPSNELPFLSESQIYALVAGNEAVRNSGLGRLVQEPIGKGTRMRTIWRLDPEKVNPDDVVTIVGTGVGGAIDAAVEAQRMLDSGRRAPAELVFNALPGGNATGTSMANGAKGGAMMISAECASGIYAINEGIRRIRNGEAIAAIVGGTESTMTPIGFSLFDSLGALSSEPDPEKTPQVMSPEGGGFVYGQGAGMMILEELGHARARGANILAIAAGYGETSDAYHRSFPNPDGRQQQRAMEQAIEDARGFPPTGYIYVSTHTTGTGADGGELTNIKTVAQKYGILHRILASGTKGMHAHELGGSGAVEAIKSLLVLRDGIIPPVTKTKRLVPEAEGLEIVLYESRRADVTAAWIDSFGFGGPNGILILKKYT